MTGFLGFRVPSPGDWSVDWDGIVASPVGPLVSRLGGVQQNPEYHGEGDALAHTRRVCEEMAADAFFRSARDVDRDILFTAAALHDVGKAATTVFEDGRWKSPRHARVGERMSRETMWKAGLSGDAKLAGFREEVCGLVGAHMIPPNVLEKAPDDPEQLTVEVSSRACDGLSIAKLCALSRADIRGRVAADLDGLLEATALFEAAAEGAGCLYSPPPWPDGFTRMRWFETGGKVPLAVPQYDGTWGTVTLMCGLPGSGKSTWVRDHMPGSPVVSLDGIRSELGVRPGGDQDAVMQEAFERARRLLREKKEFVWDATCVTGDTRRKPVGLFRDYGASVRIVWVETGWKTGLEANASRGDAAVPEDVIEGMLGRFSPPTYAEAAEIERAFPWN